MKTIVRLLIVAFLFLNVTEARAEKVQMADKKSRTLRGTTAGCTPSSTFAWLNINNARVRVNAGGDMWWDLPGGTGAKYYIPANSSSTSLYAGSLWIAGLDINQQLKCAAIRFRQAGNDFWTGPLTIDGTASIDPVTCMEYDKMYTITRAEVDDFIANCDPITGAPVAGYEIPSSIANWPAHGDVSRGMSYYLAPFFDKDKDGNYNPSMGDYPYYDVDNELCHSQVPTMDEVNEGSIKGSILADQVIKGDQTIWWVFNDKGNAHTETGGSAIGLEIRAQAFAFATNDEINNMTFYSYEIINRSTYTLTNTYFSPWTDVDLGFSRDDFVGCDVSRGLGYGYNGKNIDGTGEPEAYGANPPAVGVDFFQGPYLDPDGIDNPKYDPITGENCDESINGVNFGNGIIDDERFGMRRFVYHDNNQSDNGDPEKAAEYYNFLRGIWKNGDKMHYGGNAVPGTSGVTDLACDFMFPFDSDPCNWGTGGVVPEFNGYWSEETGNNGAPNNPYDRRFMQSAGPFTLKPGAVNYITFGVPWARSSAGTAWSSVELLRRVDDKCQAMFDNCFDVLDGPHAPDLTFRELDRKLIVYISNSDDSNNIGESYTEVDSQICGPLATDSTQRNDSIYRFEGYIVYQLANKDVNVDELNDISKARVVYQCDVKNGVSEIINYVYDDDLQASVPTLMVEGADNGIKSTFVLTQDAFTTTGDVNLINHKTYYYMAISYAYNNYQDYVVDANNPIGLFGQKTPYLAGRKNIQLYSAVPHKTVDGTIINSNYGDKLPITRWTGLGNGGNQLELSQETIDEIMSKGPASADVVFGDPEYPVAYHPTYKAGYGPIDIKVVDPLNVVSTDYAIWFDEFERKLMTNVTGDNALMGDTASKRVFKWFLKDLNTGEVFEADNTTELQTEQIFAERGISVTIHQPWLLGPTPVGKYLDTSGDTPQPLTVQKVIATNNGLITSSVTYADSSNQWLSGIRDDDNMPASALNWIRSGMYGDQGSKANNDYLVSSDPYAKGSSLPYDPDEAYESIAEGTWAPLLLTNFSRNSGQFVPGPLYKGNCRVDSIFRRLGSIDIVLTSDKSKWTRCPVIEMGLEESLTEGNAPSFTLRRAPSIDKNGNPCASMTMGASDNPEDPNYIAANGMGWFPGYAIDVETGARLNMCYGEDSYYPELNGRDMMFNPPALKETTVLSAPIAQLSDPALFDGVDNTAVMGGKHFVYIFPMNDAGNLGNNSYKISVKSPAYDAGAYLYNTMTAIENAPSSSLKGVFYTSLWGQPLWTGMPMPVEGREWLQEGNPVKISVRIATPYREGYGNFALENDTELFDTINHEGYKPYYTFSTKGCGPVMNDLEKAEEDLNMVTVIPNPYYAFSTYEENALTHKVKIANVPEKCVVTIYTVNGAKIRQFKKDSSVTSIDWDLTNFANTPIASGFYIIHVKDNKTGNETTVKFYAAMRQVDLNTF
ncbi:MAG: T9SS type A sorting domain-containing protein [Bacteroidales bacterium]|nr:T9SS type A sorting domain-containing protein [Bacteroidales bacterium]